MKLPVSPVKAKSGYKTSRPNVTILVATLAFALGAFGVFKTLEAVNLRSRISNLASSLDFQTVQIKQLIDDSTTKEATIAALTSKVESLQESNVFKELSEIKTSLSNLKKIRDKEKLYKSYGINTESVVTRMPSLLDLFADQNFSVINKTIETLDSDLEKLYEAKKEADRKAAEEAKKKFDSVMSSGGYIRWNVSTEAGTFLADILVVDLNKVKVVTDTANDSDCKKDCPLLSLANFVQRNGGFAGINGTYYCPPEYPECSSKKNSFDFPVYNSRLGKWINKKNLTWDNRALLGFKGNGGVFYKFEKSYSTGTSVDAALTMVPGLLKDGSIIVGDYNLQPKEKIKSTRSSIGYSGNKAYAVTARGVNNYDMAYVQKALGAKNAIALDGGGSINFYFQGSYYAGPGRAQANSIIFKNR